MKLQCVLCSTKGGSWLVLTFKSHKLTDGESVNLLESLNLSNNGVTSSADTSDMLHVSVVLQRFD